LDVGSGKELARFEGASEVSRPVAFSPDGRRFAVGYRNTVTVYDARTRAPAATPAIEVEGPAVDLVAFAPDGERVAVGCQDVEVRLVEVATGKPVAAFDAHGGGRGELYGLAFSRDGRRLASSAARPGFGCGTWPRRRSSPPRPVAPAPARSPSSRTAASWEPPGAA
jgi:WD40 repeat protein